MHPLAMKYTYLVVPRSKCLRHTVSQLFFTYENQYLFKVIGGDKPGKQSTLFAFYHRVKHLCNSVCNFTGRIQFNAPQ